MSKLYYHIPFREEFYDENQNMTKLYKTNLPHYDIIKDWLPKIWNECHIEKTFDGIIKDKIESCTMRCVIKDRIPTAVVTITPIKGFRLSEKRRNEIWKQLDAQMSDGFGESVDYCQIPGAPKGWCLGL